MFPNLFTLPKEKYIFQHRSEQQTSITYYITEKLKNLKIFMKFVMKRAKLVFTFYNSIIPKIKFLNLYF